MENRKALTKRQIEVLRQRAAGLPSKCMRLAGACQKTAEYHLWKVQKETGLRDPALLTQFALLAGIASWHPKVVRLAKQYLGRRAGSPALRQGPCGRPPCLPLRLAVLLVAMPLAALPVTLEWDAPATGVPDSYRLYWGGQSGAYTNSIVVTQTNRVTLLGLQPGTNYLAVTALANGLQSEYSNEIALRVPPPATNVVQLTVRVESAGLEAAAAPWLHYTSYVAQLGTFPAPVAATNASRFRAVLSMTVTNVAE